VTKILIWQLKDVSIATWFMATKTTFLLVVPKLTPGTQDGL